MRYNRKTIRITSRPEDQDPALQLISTADMKTYMRVDGTDDDDLIAELVQVATEAVQTYIGQAILTQNITLTMDGFTDKHDKLDQMGGGVFDISKNFVLGSCVNEFNVPYPPIQSIDSIKTYSIANAESTFDSSKYQLDEDGGRVYLNVGETWPSDLRDREAVKVAYTAGYGDSASDVPKPIVQAVKQYVNRMYESRGLCDIPCEVCKMLDGYRRYDLLGYA